MSAFLDERRAYARAQLEAFKTAFIERVPEPEREELLADTCLYAVGSGARGEMSEHSDLDLFIVTYKLEAKRIDEVRLQAAVIRAMKQLRLPDPSKDAWFLRLHPAAQLFDRLGRPDDDAENTLTVRMLLLLESSALVGEDAYAKLVDGAIEAYWKNVESHGGDYLPIVLVNDIVRYWRIVLLNYEAKTAKKRQELQKLDLGAAERDRRSAAIEADRRYRSCKLRCSRALTCYSAVIYLMRLEHEHHSTSRDDVKRMVGLSPTQRLEEAARYYARVQPDLALRFDAVLSSYESYLEQFAYPESVLVEALADDSRRRAFTEPAEAFGEKLFGLLEGVGAGNRLYRYVVL